MFLMELDGSKADLDVKLDPKEHQSYLWATETEAQADLCDVNLNLISISQKKATLAAFAILRLQDR